jgi:hypothetical protein
MNHVLAVETSTDILRARLNLGPEVADHVIDWAMGHVIGDRIVRNNAQTELELAVQAKVSAALLMETVEKARASRQVEPGLQEIADRLHALEGDEDDEDDDEEQESVHEGVECCLCDAIIEDEDQGESSPYGSVHTWCAVKSRRRSPQDW